MQLINSEWLKQSPYPPNVVPIKAKTLIGFDVAGGKETTVKGFYLDGEYHIQEVIERASS